MDEINEYNRKIKNGEETDANPADLLNKYREKFYDEELENKKYYYSKENDKYILNLLDNTKYEDFICSNYVDIKPLGLYTKKDLEGEDIFYEYK